MRIAAYEQDGAQHLGLLNGQAVRPLSAGLAVLDLLAAPTSSWTAA